LFFFISSSSANSTKQRLEWKNLKQTVSRPSADIGKVIICFQYVERIKSELLISVNFLELIIDLRDDEQNGANKLFRWYLDAVIGEINIAYNVINGQDFLQASEKMKTAKERVNLMLFQDAIRKFQKPYLLLQTAANGSCRF